MSSLRISHLTYHNHTGAGRAATRLCGSLRELGLDSRLHVHEKWSSCEWIIRPGTFGYELRARVIGRLDRRMTRQAAAPGQVPEVFSHNHYSLWRHRWRELADRDIAHLHWIGWSFLALEELTRFRQPVVWTLHDSWPFTGGCHLPGECTGFQKQCGFCPQLHSTDRNDLSASVWRRKIEQYARMHLALVAPSHWMAERARSSSLFSEVPIEVIPNGIDTRVFHPLDRLEARARLGLPPEARLVLFGAMGSLTGHNKGADLLADALNILIERSRHKEIVLVLFGGHAQMKPEQFPVRMIQFGIIDDDERLRTLYAAVDVTAVPSRSESFSNITLESMACGTVCAGFAVGGLPDMIEHGVNGYLAQPQNPESLAEGLLWALEGGVDGKRRSVAASQSVMKRFSQQQVVQRYLTLYEQQISRYELQRGTE